MKRPWLIHRCTLEERSHAGRPLNWDYMGSTEFEIGDQHKSLSKLFSTGMTMETVTVRLAGREFTVYLLASPNFPFQEYQPHLQQLAENQIRLQEASNFDLALNAKVNPQKSRLLQTETNVWFDFQNDVFWTLEEQDCTDLITALEYIKKGWAAQASR